MSKKTIAILIAALQICLAVPAYSQANSTSSQTGTKPASGAANPSPAVGSTVDTPTLVTIAIVFGVFVIAGLASKGYICNSCRRVPAGSGV